MKPTIVFLPLLILALVSHANAAWAKFVSINPKNAFEHKLEVTVEPLGGSKDLYTVAVTTDKDHFGFWLAVTEQPLAAAAQEFRSQVSGSYTPRDDLVLFTVLKPVPVKELKLLRLRAVFKTKVPMKQSVVVRLHKDMLRRSYIYLDHKILEKPGTEIHDGGYYYSIDIAKFVDL
ncbi:MAG: hypothetical protein ACI9R3_002988 [Verrucomicrobiales bacterium]|jgi:hypothetical protein